MKRKLAALFIAAVTIFALAGCSSSKPTSAAATPPAASAPPASGNSTESVQRGTSDPELQQLMQDQQKDEQQIDQLLQQIDKDLN